MSRGKGWGGPMGEAVARQTGGYAGRWLSGCMSQCGVAWMDGEMGGLEVNSLIIRTPCGTGSWWQQGADMWKRKYTMEEIYTQKSGALAGNGGMGCCEWGGEGGSGG